MPGKGPILMAWASKLVAQAGADAVKSGSKTYANMSYDDLVAEFKGAPNKLRDAAGDKGTNVHNALERLVDGEAAEKILADLTEVEQPYFRAAMQFFADHDPEFVYQEASVFSDAYKYAGTTDGIVKMPRFVAALNKIRAKEAPHLPPLPLDSLSVLDWKTSKGVYKEVGCQMAAYARADVMELDSGPIPMPDVVAGAVVHLMADGTYALHWADISDRVFAYFLAAMDLGGWEQETGVLSKFGQKTGRIGR